MPFDIFTLGAVRDQLADTIGDGRIDTIIQPSRYAVAAKVWAHGATRWLLLSADPQSARVCLSSARLAKAFAVPSPFIMLLRKHCEGGRIVAIRQMHLERVLTLEIAAHARDPVSLVAEIMGNRSNVILVAADGGIMGALKHIGPQHSRVRRILPHEPYTQPPPPRRPAALGGGARVDPLDTFQVSGFRFHGITAGADSIEDALAPGDVAGVDARADDGAMDSDRASKNGLAEALAGAPGDLSVGQVLVGLLQGCSPAAAADIAAAAGSDQAALIASVDHAALAAAACRLYDLFRARAWQPTVVLKDSAPVDYRAYVPVSPESFRPAPDMSAAIEQVVQGAESTDPWQSGRLRLRAAIDARRSQLERKLASLREQLARADDADELLTAGQLVLAYQYGLEPGASRLVIPELEREFPLDPSLGPVENAESYFKRYRKARDARARLPEMVAAAQVDVAFLDDLDAYVGLAESDRDLARVEDELNARFGVRRSTKKRPAAPGEPLRVSLDGGAQVLVGRNARQNERVTFDLAGRGDLWLHARGVPGAHVVLRGAVSDAAIERAAGLAAYFSKARTDGAVDVIVTEVRNVRRLPGGNPGQVTYRHERTVRAAPSPP